MLHRLRTCLLRACCLSAVAAAVEAFEGRRHFALALDGDRETTDYLQAMGSMEFSPCASEKLR